MIKRTLMGILALMLVFIGLADAEEAVNLLKNPGFEALDDRGLPVDWKRDAYDDREGITLFSISNQAYSGAHAAVVENLGMNDARFSQTVKVKPNAMYRLSGWIKATEVMDAGRGANLSVAGVYAFSESLYETNGEWVYIETYGLTDDKQDTLTVFARVGGYSGESQGTAFFDDLSLVEVQELPEGVFADAWYVIEKAPVIQPVTEDEAAPAAPFWPWLIVIAVLYAAISMWILRHLQLDRRESALREAGNPSGFFGIPGFVVLGFVAAGLLRLIVAWRVDGYQVDVNCFTAWGNTMSSVGPGLFYQSNWCDYVPGYIYVMGLNGLLAKAFGSLVSPAFIHKLVPMACDLIGACIVYRLAAEHRFTRRQAGMLAMLMVFNPAVFLNSAAWCQIDSVLCVGLMLVAYLALHRKWAIVLPVYVLCILIKPQALMLGFLGLAALVQEWINHPNPADAAKGNWLQQLSPTRREMLIGVAISLILALVIILPFCPNQESPGWLINLYKDTLASYPHATVNTANLFYLFDGNWDGIENPAAAGSCVFFMLLATAWGAYTYFRRRSRLRRWYIEPVLAALYAAVYLILAVSGCNWLQLGIATMSMAFAMVLPMFIRSGKLEMLPLCGAVLFLLLYVFGIKMHERYLFPAVFLLGMAYALRRDWRILVLLIGASCVLFVNEGVILDNSLRLGSSMGHLNPDNNTLADILSVLHVIFAISSIWVCHSVCVEDADAPLIPVRVKERQPAATTEHAACTPLNFKGDASLGLNRKDGILMLVVTALYAVVTLTTLGSTKAPQTTWKSSSSNEQVIIDLGKQYTDFSMMYFCQVSYSNFAVSVSDTLDEQGWSEEYPAQMAEGMCFQWKYLNPSYTSGGKPSFADAQSFEDVQKLTGRYVKLIPKQIGLAVNELLFKDKEGNIIPDVSVIGRTNGNASSPLYSDPACLVDEQNTLDGEPNWWNSTYFDEIYHARTAYEHLKGTTAYEWTHPPLGKIIMSWFIGIFGMTPFGWRFAGAFCGILMLPAMYLLVKQLTKRTDMAFVAMMLMTLDCMHFTQTRLATIDSYPVLFIMLSYFFMLRFMQRDIVLEDIRSVLPDLALSGFFMGCSVASKWIGAYAGIGLAVLYFWTCLRHMRMGKLAAAMQNDGEPYTAEEREILQQREKLAFKRFAALSLWCLLFFVAVPLLIYILSYTVHYAYMDFDSIGDFLKTVIRCQENMLDYHAEPGRGMDHHFYSPWYEWPLMVTPMYYASAAFKPEGMTYAIFCFGNPWVWIIGIVGIAYTLVCWVKGHCYRLKDTEGMLQVYRRDWDVSSAFILIGLLAQYLPWVLVPRGTYMYHYFASVPFLILGTVLMLHHLTRRWPTAGKGLCIAYLVLSLVWFILLFPYASGLMTPNAWMDFIRDYPYLSTLENYWSNETLINLNNILEKIPIFPNVYHH